MEAGEGVKRKIFIYQKYYNIMINIKNMKEIFSESNNIFVERYWNPCVETIRKKWDRLKEVAKREDDKCKTIVATICAAAVILQSAVYYIELKKKENLIKNLLLQKQKIEEVWNERYDRISKRVFSLEKERAEFYKIKEEVKGKEANLYKKISDLKNEISYLKNKNNYLASKLEGYEEVQKLPWSKKVLGGPKIVQKKMEIYEKIKVRGVTLELLEVRKESVVIEVESEKYSGRVHIIQGSFVRKDKATIFLDEVNYKDKTAEITVFVK